MELVLGQKPQMKCVQWTLEKKPNQKNFILNDALLVENFEKFISMGLR